MSHVRCLLALLWVCLGASAHAAAPAQAPVNFTREIRTILSENCFQCHGPDEKNRKAGLRLDTEAGAKTPGKSGGIAVVPRDLAKSELLARITTADPDDVMPPPSTGKKITPAQLELLQRWIQAGAPWGAHWAYEKPVRLPPPTTTSPLATWPRNDIDRFVLARLEREGLKPSPEANRETLIRRVSLDLTGLPPTPAEVDQFLQDDRADAYGRLVDRLLASRTFGEHWARMWLDLARYADSAGYADDPGRVIWGYRDYVINAFNNNTPFDQFTLEQLAGDLLPGGGEQQRVATAFHRNTMTNNEGGTNDEEWRNAAVVDRVNTTMAVWMGTSMGCAQCHTHKYDPITQKEYFQFFAFLNNTADADRPDESPTLEFFPLTEQQKRASLEASIARIHQQFDRPPKAWLDGLNAWETQFPTRMPWVSLNEIATSLPATTATTNTTLTLDGPAPLAQLTALRLETIPTQHQGSPITGTATNGGFQLTRLSATVVPPATLRPSARFVRIEGPGKGRFLMLAEVQVFSGTTNIATRGKATQSSTGFGGEAKRAIDGKTDGDYNRSNSVTHTESTDAQPWWEVDLGTETPIDRVVVWNRTDGRQDELRDFKVVALDAGRKPTFSTTVAANPKPSHSVSASGAQEIRFTAAFASSSTPGLDAASILNNTDKKKGWSPANPRTRQTLTLLPETAVRIPEGSRIQVQLDHPTPENRLASFRVLLTGDPAAAQLAGTPEEVVAALTLPRSRRTAAERNRIRDHYVRRIAPEAAGPRAQLADLQKQLAASKPSQLPVLRELPPEQKRLTRFQYRGNFMDLGDEVNEGTPAAFHPLPTGEPKTRLTLAKWLVNENNPLTARVLANRLWEQVFGIGIVRTTEEFGAQGESPSHPELLDWMATELHRLRWDTKALLRLIVTSATYRQDSKSPADLLERDPDNRLLARGPRFRMPAEVLRDQALAVSGLLSPRMLGPSVRPPRPALGLSAAFGRNMDWETSPGEDRYRRAVYTEIRRTSPYPSMATFDAPSREVCTTRRSRTNTPLQALVTLNDPVYVEAAQALARRIVAEGGSLTSERAAFGIRTCLSRKPTDAEIERLVRLHAAALAAYTADADAAARMATDPLGPAPKGMAVPELAAWTAVANVLLNLDEFLMKR